MEDWQEDRRQFEQWMLTERGDNRKELDRLKEIIPTILEECVTEKQRTYMMHYVVEQKNVCEIAEMYDINASTVSRGIHRGLKRVYRYIRFATPGFVNYEQEKVNLKKGRASRKRRDGNVQ